MCRRLAEVLQGFGKARFLCEVSAPSDCNLFVWKLEIELEGRDKQVAAAIGKARGRRIRQEKDAPTGWQ